MDMRDNRGVPAGPVIVSLVVLGLGGAYLGVTCHTLPGSGGGRGMAVGSVLRVVVWDIGRRDGGAAPHDVADHVARVLSRMTPHVVALQGVSGRAQATRVARAMPGAWRTVVIPWSSTGAGHLAVLTHPDMELRSRALVEAPGGASALVVTVATPARRTAHIVCHRAAGLDAPARTAYIERIIDWCDEHPAHVAILCGRVTPYGAATGDAGDGTATVARSGGAVRVLTGRFVAAVPRGGVGGSNGALTSELYVAPRTTVLHEVAVMHDAAVGPIDHAPVALDLTP